MYREGSLCRERVQHASITLKIDPKKQDRENGVWVEGNSVFEFDTEIVPKEATHFWYHACYSNLNDSREFSMTLNVSFKSVK